MSIAQSSVAHCRRTCLFSGRVQGVGFRFTVQNIAHSFDVHGYVRNLPDGRVELVMEGQEEEMNHMLESIRERMTGFIRNVTSARAPATGEFSRFNIRR